MFIGHMDADAFYCSAERVRFPALVGKPLGVLGNQGASVIARSYEMRDFDIPVGMPVWEAKKLCPQGVYVKRDFRWYEVLSQKMLAILKRFSPSVEYYSIDECFFEAVLEPGQTYQELAEAIREAIFQEVKIPVTVGIGRSRTLAKLTSKVAKPYGALALTDREAEWCLLDHSPITKIAGIAKRRAARLEPYGIETSLDLAFSERHLIRSLLTVVGERLWFELNGEAVIPLCTTRPPHKMIGRGGSIGKATSDPDIVYGWLVRTLERLIEALDYYHVRPARLEVTVGHYQEHMKSVMLNLSSPTIRFDHLLEAANEGLCRAWDRSKRLHRFHLLAHHLHWPTSVQQGLFDRPAEQVDAIAKLKRNINEKLGRFTVRSGATLYLTEHYRDEAWGYEICDVQGKMCF